MLTRTNVRCGLCGAATKRAFDGRWKCACGWALDDSPQTLSVHVQEPIPATINDDHVNQTINDGMQNLPPIPESAMQLIQLMYKQLNHLRAKVQQAEQLTNAVNDMLFVNQLDSLASPKETLLALCDHEQAVGALNTFERLKPLLESWETMPPSLAYIKYLATHGTCPECSAPRFLPLSCYRCNYDFK